MAAVATRVSRAQEEQLRKRFPGINPAALTDSQLQRVIQFANLPLQTQQKLNELAQARLPAANDSPYLALITRPEAAEPNLSAQTSVYELDRPVPAVTRPIVPMVPAIRECERNIESTRLPGGVMASTAIAAEPALVEAGAREQRVAHTLLMTSAAEKRLEAAMLISGLPSGVAQNLQNELTVLRDRRQSLEMDPNQVSDEKLLSMERNLAALAVALDRPSVTQLTMERDKNESLINMSAIALATPEMMQREAERLQQQHPRARVSVQPYDSAQQDGEYQEFKVMILGADPADFEKNADALNNNLFAQFNPEMQDMMDELNDQKALKLAREQQDSGMGLHPGIG